MNKNEIKDLLKIIDRCYKTEYSLDKDIIEDWFKVLKNYELKDMTQSLDNYMRNYTQFAPKVYELVRGYQTIEGKKILEGATTRCPFCNKVIGFDDEKHVDRCRSIEFIKSVVHRFKNQEIDKDKYRNMSEEEFDKYYLAAMKLAFEKTTNENERHLCQIYLENRGE